MKTLGQLLQERRRNKNISLEQAATDTHIRKAYLSNLEEGKYQAFPIQLQIRGFITIYARYLDIDPEDALAFFRREQPQIHETIPLRFKLPTIRQPSFKITSQLIMTFSIIALMSLAVGYIIWQYIAFSGAPNIEIFSPRDGLVTNQNTIKIEGITSEDSRITLNNTSIRVTAEGYFSQDIPLSEGINVLTFVAVNSSGKSTTIKRIVRYDTE